MERVCPIDGVAFWQSTTLKRQQTYCSRVCTIAAAQLAKATPEHAFGMGLPLVGLSVMAYCSPCGGVFTPDRNRTTYCSNECQQSGRLETRAALRWIAPTIDPPAATVPTCRECGTPVEAGRYVCEECRRPAYASRPDRVVTCAICGDRFLARQGPGRYCSRRCSRRSEPYRAGRALRRARRAQVPREMVYRAEVGERDGWVCQLCGNPVDRQVVVPSPLSPTLDHRIPLAHGGHHTYANVQLAHFRCNSLKGDRDVRTGYGVIFFADPQPPRTASEPYFRDANIPNPKASGR